MVERPSENEYAPFYAGYVARVPERDVLAALEAQPGALRRLAAKTGPERERHRYAPGKWSVREIFGHLTDAERVFGYRAFCISRGESAPLPGFDEQHYVAESGYDERSLSDLAAEFAALRAVNLATLRRFDPATFARTGTANGTPVSVRALAYIMAGHVRHHLHVLQERYGVALPA